MDTDCWSDHTLHKIHPNQQGQNAQKVYQNRTMIRQFSSSTHDILQLKHLVPAVAVVPQLDEVVVDPGVIDRTQPLGCLQLLAIAVVVFVLFLS